MATGKTVNDRRKKRGKPRQKAGQKPKPNLTVSAETVQGPDKTVKSVRTDEPGPRTVADELSFVEEGQNPFAEQGKYRTILYNAVHHLAVVPTNGRLASKIILRRIP